MADSDPAFPGAPPGCRVLAFACLTRGFVGTFPRAISPAAVFRAIPAHDKIQLELRKPNGETIVKRLIRRLDGNATQV